MITHILQIVFALVILVLGCYLVPLLIQLRKTAAAMEVLARSSAQDISRVADDVHQIKVQVDEVTGMAKEALLLPVSLNQALKGLVKAIPAIFSSKKTGSNLFDLLLGGIQAVTSLFRR